jgi:ABC-type uncharacterized transport system permease subunit
MDNYILNYSAIILYFACSTLLFFRLRHPLKQTADKSSALSKKQILIFGLGALILHSISVFNSLNAANGINLGFYNALSLTAVFITFFTLVETWRHPIDILTVALLPITAITVLFNMDNNSSHLLAADSSRALVFHIIASIIAYSLLALAALQAVLLSIQNKFLHAHQPGGIIRIMPPLKNMETLLFEIIIAGFITLTISLGSGLIFLENMFVQQLAHKTILSILAWLLFLILLIGRWKLGWRGRTAIRWTLSGFASLMLAYFGSKFVLEIVLT